MTLDKQEWLLKAILYVASKHDDRAWVRDNHSKDHDRFMESEKRESGEIRDQIEKKIQVENVSDDATGMLNSEIQEAIRRVRYGLDHPGEPLSFMAEPPFEKLLLAYIMKVEGMEQTENPQIDWYRVGILHALRALKLDIECSRLGETNQEHLTGSQSMEELSLNVKRVYLFDEIKTLWVEHYRRFEVSKLIEDDAQKITDKIFKALSKKVKVPNLTDVDIVEGIKSLRRGNIGADKRATLMTIIKVNGLENIDAPSLRASLSAGRREIREIS